MDALLNQIKETSKLIKQNSQFDNGKQPIQQASPQQNNSFTTITNDRKRNLSTSSNNFSSEEVIDLTASDEEEVNSLIRTPKLPRLSVPHHHMQTKNFPQSLQSMQQQQPRVLQRNSNSLNEIVCFGKLEGSIQQTNFKAIITLVSKVNNNFGIIKVKLYPNKNPDNTV
ncbi:hypothetical protein HK099_000666, partial [Clydaea vesicula]